MAAKRVYSSTLSEKSILAILLAFLAALYLLFMGGCDVKSTDSVEEISETHYNRGQAELRKGNFNEALGAFLKVIEKRQDAPESHLEAGRIYLSSLNDPIAAIYHFKKYLELKPDSKISGNVKQMIEIAQKRFAATLPLTPFTNNVELEEIISKLQKENYELKQRLATYADTIDKLEKHQKKAEQKKSEALAAKSENGNVQVQNNNNLKTMQATVPEIKKDTVSEYVVKPGDTLSSISRKVYGTTSRWKDIYKSNRATLASPEALKPGQTLKMPK